VRQATASQLAQSDCRTAALPDPVANFWGPTRDTAPHAATRGAVSLVGSPAVGPTGQPDRSLSIWTSPAKGTGIRAGADRRSQRRLAVLSLRSTSFPSHEAVQGWKHAPAATYGARSTTVWRWRGQSHRSAHCALNVTSRILGTHQTGHSRFVEPRCGGGGHRDQEWRGQLGRRARRVAEVCVLRRPINHGGLVCNDDAQRCSFCSR
jgi:hypothetical protein